jgi:hypothetical protein
LIFGRINADRRKNPPGGDHPEDFACGKTESGMIMDQEKKNCPHCGQPMLKWVPADMSSWGYGHQYVCFNDECPYYIKGWDWMRSQYNQNISYRYRYNPANGESGPLPVFSPNALRSGIIE